MIPHISMHMNELQLNVKVIACGLCLKMHSPVTMVIKLVKHQQRLRELNVTDRQMDRGALQYLPSRAFDAAGDKNT